MCACVGVCERACVRPSVRACVFFSRFGQWMLSSKGLSKEDSSRERSLVAVACQAPVAESLQGFAPDRSAECVVSPPVDAYLLPLSTFDGRLGECSMGFKWLSARRCLADFPALARPMPRIGQRGLCAAVGFPSGLWLSGAQRFAILCLSRRPAQRGRLLHLKGQRPPAAESWTVELVPGDDRTRVETRVQLLSHARPMGCAGCRARW